MVIESASIEFIRSAAGKFAGQLATRWLLDWFKRRQLAKVYRQSAEEIVNLCEQEGYPVRSPVWNRVVSLIGSEKGGHQVARWHTH